MFWKKTTVVEQREKCLKAKWLAIIRYRTRVWFCRQKKVAAMHEKFSHSKKNIVTRSVTFKGLVNFFERFFLLATFLFNLGWFFLLDSLIRWRGGNCWEFWQWNSNIMCWRSFTLVMDAKNNVFDKNSAFVGCVEQEHGFSRGMIYVARPRAQPAFLAHTSSLSKTCAKQCKC